MLKVTIELWPYGDDTRRTVIAEAEIWNDGNHPHGPVYGHYKGVFHAPGTKTFYLAIPDHERGLGAWMLLARFLAAMNSLKTVPDASTSSDIDKAKCAK